MKTFKPLFAIMLSLLVGFSSCVHYLEDEKTAEQDMVTRSAEEYIAETDFIYTEAGGKDYFSIRKDKVIIKAGSETEAEGLARQPVFLSAHHVGYRFVLASINPEKTTLDDLLKLQGVVDATYGLEYIDGTIQYPTDEIYGNFEGRSVEKVLDEAGLRESVTEVRSPHPYFKGYLIRLNVKLGEVLSICRGLSESGKGIAAPSFFREMKPCNAYYPDQWSFNNTGQYGSTTFLTDINVEDAWRIARGISDVKIAVIDEGVALGHPDLQANLLPGYDATVNAPGGANGSPYANNAHGTACAGIIGAVNNSIGVTGVAAGCKIIPVRIAYDLEDGWGWRTCDTWVMDGIFEACFSLGADVLNCSWGGGSESQIIDQAINGATTYGRGGKGCVFVFTSGNDNLATVNYPARLDKVIAVGTTSFDGQRKHPGSPDGEWRWGSNYGQGLDVVAPGVLIPTTDIQGNAGYNPVYPLHTLNGGNILWSDYPDQNYTVWFNGTSAAAPHVAGIAALILSVYSSFEWQEVVDIIRSTASHPNNWNVETGYGLVDAYAAVAKARDIVYGPPIISGPFRTIVDNVVTYTVPQPPPEMTFLGWSVSPGTYSAMSGTGNLYFPVRFEQTGSYTLTARFQEPDGVGVYETHKTVGVVYPAVIPGSIAGKQRIYWYQTPALLSSVSSASGGVSGTTITYQWYSSTSSPYISQQLIPGATGLDYQPPRLDLTTIFWRVASDGFTTATSNQIEVTIMGYPPIQGGTIGPEYQTVQIGNIPQVLHYRVLPTGGSGTNTYQWQSHSGNGNWYDITGATGEAYYMHNPPTTPGTYYYRCRATSGGASAYSNAVTITMIN